MDDTKAIDPETVIPQHVEYNYSCAECGVFHVNLIDAIWCCLQKENDCE